MQTYVVNLKDKEVVKGPWSQPNVESGASLLHALPRASFTCQIRHVVTLFAGACGGVLVFGDQSIAHLKGDPKVRQHPQFCSAFALISRRILRYLFP